MRLHRRSLVVAAAVRAVETMLGARIHLDIDAVVVLEALGDFLHRIHRDVAVLFAEVHQHRHLDFIGPLQLVLDAAAVIGDGHVDQAVGGGVVGQHAAKTETDGCDAAYQTGLGLERVEGQFDIGLRLADVGGVHQLDRPFPAGFVVAQLDARTTAPEQVRGDHQITISGVLLGHRADVFIDAENLLNQHDPRTFAGMGNRQVGAEFTVGAVDLDPLGGHAHGGLLSSRVSGVTWANSLNVDQSPWRRRVYRTPGHPA